MIADSGRLAIMGRGDKGGKNQERTLQNDLQHALLENEDSLNVIERLKVDMKALADENEALTKDMHGYLEAINWIKTENQKLEETASKKDLQLKGAQQEILRLEAQLCCAENDLGSEWKERKDDRLKLQNDLVEAHMEKQQMHQQLSALIEKVATAQDGLAELHMGKKKSSQQNEFYRNLVAGCKRCQKLSLKDNDEPGSPLYTIGRNQVEIDFGSGAPRSIETVPSQPRPKRRASLAAVLPAKWTASRVQPVCMDVAFNKATESYPAPVPSVGRRPSMGAATQFMRNAAKDISPASAHGPRAGGQEWRSDKPHTGPMRQRRASLAAASPVIVQCRPKFERRSCGTVENLFNEADEERHAASISSRQEGSDSESDNTGLLKLTREMWDGVKHNRPIQTSMVDISPSVGHQAVY